MPRKPMCVKLLRALMVVQIVTIIILFSVIGYWFFFTGFASKEPTVRPTLLIEIGPDFGNFTHNGTTYWNCSIFIRKVSPRDSSIKWSHTRLDIRIDRETVRSNISIQQGYDSVKKPSFQAYHIDTAGKEDRIDGGDVINFCFINESLKNALVRVTYHGGIIGNIFLRESYFE